MAVILVMVTLVVVLAHAQGRKLGPETAKTIQSAALDPTFQTTKLDRVALLPFVNAAKFKEAASIISKNFVSQLSQLHPEFKFITPEEMMNSITSSGLDDQYNIFLGDYTTSGTVSREFLAALRDKRQIDAILVGSITYWGEGQEQIKSLLGGIQYRKAWMAGMAMKLYRTTDGRRIWLGEDLLIVRKQDQLPEAAQALSEIFARFFGRAAY
jgi:hypothetical protein